MPRIDPAKGIFFAEIEENINGVEEDIDAVQENNNQVKESNDTNETQTIILL